MVVSGSRPRRQVRPDPPSAADDSRLRRECGEDFRCLTAIFGFFRGATRVRCASLRATATRLARDGWMEGCAMATKKTAGGGKKTLSKSGLITAITESAGEELSRRQVKTVLESLIEVGHRELKKQGIFTLPGFAKFR